MDKALSDNTPGVRCFGIINPAEAYRNCLAAHMRLDRVAASISRSWVSLIM